MDPGTLAEFSKFNAVRGRGRGEGEEMEGVSLRMERGGGGGGGGERERVGLVSLGIKPGDRSHRRLPEPVGISESPRRASAPVFRCIEKEAGVLTLGDGPGEAR